MKTSIEGEFEVTVDDLQRAAREMPETRFVQWLVPILIIPAFFVGFWHDGPPDRFFVHMMVFVVIVMVMVAMNRGKQAARRQWQDMRPEARHVRFRFDPDSVAFETPGASSRHSYSALYGFVEGKTHLLFYTQTAIAQMVPKRALDAEDLALVLSWAARIPPRQRPFKGWYLLLIWLLLIVSFLAIWKLLAPAPREHDDARGVLSSVGTQQWHPGNQPSAS